MNEAFMQELYFDAYCLLQSKETCGRRREISSNPVCMRQSIKLLQDVKLFSMVLQGVRFEILSIGGARLIFILVSALSYQ